MLSQLQLINHNLDGILDSPAVHDAVRVSNASAYRGPQGTATMNPGSCAACCASNLQSNLSIGERDRNPDLLVNDASRAAVKNNKIKGARGNGHELKECLTCGVGHLCCLWAALPHVDRLGILPVPAQMPIDRALRYWCYCLRQNKRISCSILHVKENTYLDSRVLRSTLLLCHSPRLSFCSLSPAIPTPHSEFQANATIQRRPRHLLLSQVQAVYLHRWSRNPARRSRGE